MQKLERVVNYDINKHFAAFSSVLNLLPQKRRKRRIIFKTGFNSC